MVWQLHHVFVTVASPAEGDRLVEAGLAEGDPNTHPGQGTANRRFFFGDFYLELLFAVDLDEARSPAIARTRLAERCTRTQADWGRLGFALQGDGEPPFPTWDYCPPYLPAGMVIRMADNCDRLDEPIIFWLPGRPAEAARPRVSLGPAPPPTASAPLRTLIDLGLVVVDEDAAPGMTIHPANGATDAALLPTSPLTVRSL